MGGARASRLPTPGILLVVPVPGGLTKASTLKDESVDKGKRPNLGLWGGVRVGRVSDTRGVFGRLASLLVGVLFVVLCSHALRTQ
jgi:hypothetical protein